MTNSAGGSINPMSPGGNMNPMSPGGGSMNPMNPGASMTGTGSSSGSRNSGSGRMITAMIVIPFYQIHAITITINTTR